MTYDLFLENLQQFLADIKRKNWVWDQDLDQSYQAVLATQQKPVDKILIGMIGDCEEESKKSGLPNTKPWRGVFGAMLDQTPKDFFSQNNHNRKINIWAPALHSLNFDDVMLLHNHGVNFNRTAEVASVLMHEKTPESYKKLGEWFDEIEQETQFYLFKIIVKWRIDPGARALFELHVNDKFKPAAAFMGDFLRHRGGGRRARDQQIKEVVAAAAILNMISDPEQILSAVGDGMESQWGEILAKTPDERTARDQFKVYAEKILETFEHWIQDKPDDHPDIVRITNIVLEKGLPVMGVWKAKRDRFAIEQNLDLNIGLASKPRKI